MQGFAFAANVRNDGPHCSMVEDAPRSAMGRLCYSTPWADSGNNPDLSETFMPPYFALNL